MTDRVRVMLLYGGRSAEHDVSRTGAVTVARSLDPRRYDIVPVAIRTDGRWVVPTEARTQIAAGGDALPEAFPADGEEAPGVATLVTAGEEAIASEALAEVDVVFPLLHGPYGEDGTIQGLLELAGLPYVGAGVVASAVAMDKVAARRAFTAAGLPQPDWTAFREGGNREALRRDAERLGYPCFAKPANMGSSVGVSKVHDASELDDAIDAALAFDEWILVEEGIAGREIEVAVIGDDPPVVSVAGEAIPEHEFYTYEAKYEAGLAEFVAPADLTDDEVAQVQALTVRAFEAVRGEVTARIDFFFEEGGRGFLVNEVNTMPGMTPTSMYPMLWEASGWTYPQVCDRLIELALARHTRRATRAGRQRWE